MPVADKMPTLDITNFGVDIWCNILQFLSVRDVVQLSMTNRYIHSLGLLELFLQSNAQALLKQRKEVECFIDQNARAVRWQSATSAGCTSFKVITGMDLSMAGLRYQLRDISSLARCRNLTQLEISGYVDLTDLSPLAPCRALEALNLDSCSEVNDITPLAACRFLSILKLSSCSQIRSFDPLAALQRLHSLDVSHCYLENLDVLASLPVLHTLDMSGCMIGYTATTIAPYWRYRRQGRRGAPPLLGDINPLASCKALAVLILAYCDGIEDYTPLTRCTKLEALYLDGSKIQHLPSLEHCGSLRTLSLQNSEFHSVAPLSTCKRLQVLNIIGCLEIHDITPLLQCQDLRMVSFTRGNRLEGRNKLRQTGVYMEWEETYYDSDENAMVGGDIRNSWHLVRYGRALRSRISWPLNKKAWLTLATVPPNRRWYRTSAHPPDAMFDHRHRASMEYPAFIHPLITGLRITHVTAFELPTHPALTPQSKLALPKFATVWIPPGEALATLGFVQRRQLIAVGLFPTPPPANLPAHMPCMKLLAILPDHSTSGFNSGSPTECPSTTLYLIAVLGSRRIEAFTVRWRLVLPVLRASLRNIYGPPTVSGHHSYPVLWDGRHKLRPGMEMCSPRQCTETE